MARLRFNKLAAIYRLCAALAVELADVPPTISGMCENQKLSDKSTEGLEEFIDDVKAGGNL